MYQPRSCANPLIEAHLMSQLSTNPGTVRVREWYQRHKTDPEVRESRRRRSKNWRDKNKHSQPHQQRKAELDLAYRIKVRDSEEFREKRNKFNIKYRQTSNTSLISVNNWKARSPEKVRAHYCVRYAIRTGKLIRPLECTRCHSVVCPTRDGKSGFHAHHKDYSKPLEVEWLCAFCHGNERRKHR